MNKSLNIRLAETTDSASIYELICSLSSKRFPFDAFDAIFRCNLANEAWRFWVAVVDGHIAGMISLHTTELLHHCGPVGEIQEFIAATEFRGIGVGRLLMDAVKAYANERGLLSLEVTTNRRRVENVVMYERLGFVLSHNKFTIDPPGGPHS